MTKPKHLAYTKQTKNNSSVIFFGFALKVPLGCHTIKLKNLLACKYAVFYGMFDTVLNVFKCVTHAYDQNTTKLRLIL